MTPTSGQWRSVSVAGRSMRCYVALPELDSAPGVLVCMHGPGVDEFVIDRCNHLAADGYGAIAPDLYYRQDPPAPTPRDAAERLRDEEALVDLAAAREALAAERHIDGARLGVVGFCMGGRLAFLHATSEPNLAAAVCFYPGDLMVSRGDGPSPIERAATIRAPLLGIFGADDENPSAQDAATVDTELTRHGIIHELEIYEDAGHAFLHFGRPEQFRPKAAADAWQRCLAWLDLYL